MKIIRFRKRIITLVSKVTGVLAITLLVVMCLGDCIKCKAYLTNIATMIGMKDEDGLDRQDGWFSNNWDASNSLALMMRNYSGNGSTYVSNCTASQGMKYLKNSAIFFIHTHGSQTTVKFTSNKGVVSRWTEDDFESMGSTDLSNEDLVVYGTCNAGQGGSKATNIVNLTFQKGARHVVGFRGTTLVNQTNDFFHQFLHELGTDEENLQDAYDNALFWVKVWNWGKAGGIDNVLIRGDQEDKFVP